MQSKYRCWILMRLRARGEVPEAMYKATLSRTFRECEELGAGRIQRLIASHGSDRFMTPVL